MAENDLPWQVYRAHPGDARAPRTTPQGSLFFLLLNANKKSLTPNLKAAEGKALFRKLIASCDVLVVRRACCRAGTYAPRRRDLTV